MVSIAPLVASYTVHYGLTKPEVGASVDVWGDMLNADLDAIDALVYSVQTASGQKVKTLYYTATAGQTVFSLSTPDLFGQTYSPTAPIEVQVTAGGNRLMPDPGGGVGGYTVNLVGNSVTLTWPAGAGETIVFDLFSNLTIAPPSFSGAVGEEVLIITTLNVLPPLSRTPDGRIFTLFVEGRAFSPIVPSPPFTIAGNIITWTSTIYSVVPGAEVVALYSSGGVGGGSNRKASCP